MDRVYAENETFDVANELLEVLSPGREATVVSFTGDLGAGKTTLTQAIAKALGIKEMVVSPTFVIMKKYKTHNDRFKILYHLDAYRIEENSELVPLGWERIIVEPDTLVIVEWGERVKSMLPPQAHLFTLEHKGNIRRIYAS